MEGPDVEDPDMKGIIPRSIDLIFEEVDSAPPTMKHEIKVGSSM